MSKDYEDIINLPRPISKKREAMSIKNRAAQFSPFAALTGHEEVIREEARETQKRINLDPYMKEELNRKLNLLLSQLKEKHRVKICYFQEDERKAGGEYVTIEGTLRKVDTYKGIIHMADKKLIPIKEIIDIDGDIFRKIMS